MLRALPLEFLPVSLVSVLHVSETLRMMPLWIIADGVVPGFVWRHLRQRAGASVRAKTGGGDQ